MDNNISGVSQQQGGNDSLTFSSQYGNILVSSLPIVSGNQNNQQAQNNFIEPTLNTNEPIQQPINNNSTSNESSEDVFVLIEKLATLLNSGVLTQDEFDTKKAELLSRI